MPRHPPLGDRPRFAVERFIVEYARGEEEKLGEPSLSVTERVAHLRLAVAISERPHGRLGRDLDITP
jgi:hypothetical protein